MPMTVFLYQQNGYPKFRSWKEKWFSLYFDEPNKGFKLVDSKTIQISFGKNEQGEQMRITGSLKEPFSFKQNEVIKTFRMCKQQGNRFYGIFTIERRTEHEKEVKKVEKNIKKMKREFLNTYSIAKRSPKKKNKTKKKSNIDYPVFSKGTK